MSTVLGIDLGTQSVKALVYNDCDKKTLALTTSPLDVDYRDDGSAEQQAGDWLVALQNCLLQIPEAIRMSIDALSVSGQQHGFVPLDSNGDVLSPVKLWCDTSTSVECDEIMRAFGGEQACRDKAGNSILTGYTAPKILWLKKHRTALYERLATILLPHDYINFVLTGERVMEYGDASGTGLLDIRKKTWSPGLLRALDTELNLLNCLPTLVSAQQQIGCVQPNSAKQFGLPAGIPVASGGGDNMMGAIGTGNTRDGILTMSLGTSGTVYGFSSEPIIDPKGEISAFCSSNDGWLPLLCTLNCTNATTLVHQCLDRGLEDVEKALLSTKIGSGGVISLPFFQGERTPNLPNATASIHGLTANNFTPANLIRATLEAVSFALRYGVDRLQNLKLDASEIRLIGGGAKSAAWCQIIADVCNLPVVLLDNEEGAAFGAALQALWMLDGTTNEWSHDSLQAIVDTHVSMSQPSYLPEPAAVKEYEGIYQRYCSILASTS